MNVRTYGIRVEAVFIRVPGLEGELSGFYATFELRSKGFDQVHLLLADALHSRMRVHGVVPNEKWPFKAYYLIDAIWEVAGVEGGVRQVADKGFTFFGINMFDRLRESVRGALLKVFRPNALFSF